MISLPTNICLRASSDSRAVEGVLVKVVVHATRKNNFVSFHGPSDNDGRIVITRENILLEADSDRKMFQMDYGHPEIDFSGIIDIQPCNSIVLQRAIKAYEEYKNYCSFPTEGYEQKLHMAYQRMMAEKWGKLTLDNLEFDGIARVNLI